MTGWLIRSQPITFYKGFDWLCRLTAATVLFERRQSIVYTSINIRFTGVTQDYNVCQWLTKSRFQVDLACRWKLPVSPWRITNEMNTPATRLDGLGRLDLSQAGWSASSAHTSGRSIWRPCNRNSLLYALASSHVTAKPNANGDCITQNSASFTRYPLKFVTRM